jgi:hypothetical protein
MCTVSKSLPILHDKYTNLYAFTLHYRPWKSLISNGTSWLNKRLFNNNGISLYSPYSIRTCTILLFKLIIALYICSSGLRKTLHLQLRWRKQNSQTSKLATVPSSGLHNNQLGARTRTHNLLK